MALNVNRWLKYAKARIDSAVGSGHESLDRLEAEQEAERADKPWLGSDSTAPTFDEARARIEWEADQQAKKADRHRDGEAAEAKGAKGAGARASDDADTPHHRKTDAGPSGAERHSTPADQPTKSGGDTSSDTPPSGVSNADPGPDPRSPQQIAEDAERETARLELEDRQQKSAERLDQIRRELGIDDPPEP